MSLKIISKFPQSCHWKFGAKAPHRAVKLQTHSASLYSSYTYCTTSIHTKCLSRTQEQNICITFSSIHKQSSFSRTAALFRYSRLRHCRRIATTLSSIHITQRHTQLSAVISGVVFFFASGLFFLPVRMVIKQSDCFRSSRSLCLRIFGAGGKCLFHSANQIN